MSVERSIAMLKFLESSGWGDAEHAPLAGDASTRRYVRVRQNGKSAMVMDQPQGAEAPAAGANASAEERRALGYNAVARLAGADTARFVAASNYLRSRGLSAPEIYAADPAQGFLLLEDLGDDLYSDVIGMRAEEMVLYETAIDALAVLHAQSAPSILPPDKPLHSYDETALVAETDLMTEWFFPVALNRTVSEAEATEHRALWTETLESVTGAHNVFVHRDYHAQNLIWLPSRTGVARVGLIDFQDAVAGAQAYDLISLTEDARRDVSPELAEAMTKRYLAAMRAQGMALDEAAFRASVAVFAAQRNAKIAGIFSRLWKRDGKPRYLGYLTRVWGYLNRDLEHPAMAKLKAWYDRAIPAAARGTPKIEGVTV